MSKESKPLRGLRCEIYKWSLGDCSNGGISSRCNHVTLIGVGCEVFEADAEAPAVVLVKRNLGGNIGEYLHAEPVDKPEGKSWAMHGGCYIKGDSRFPNKYPIALHDRFE